MHANIMLIIGSIFTLLLLMAVGFFMERRGFFSRDTQKQMSQLLVSIVSPCLIVSNMPAESTPETLRAFETVGSASLAILLLSAAFAQALFRRQPDDTRVTLRYSVVYGNIAYMGLPLLVATFGDGVILYVAIAGAVFNVMVWTHGVWLMNPHAGKISIKMIANPGIVAFLVGMFFMQTGFQLPLPLKTAVANLGAMNTPLAMLLVGAQMAEADLLSVFRDKRLYAAATLRLLVVPITAMLLLYPFHLEETMYLTLVILSGCPVATLANTFSQLYGRDTKTSAQLVMLSTVLCIATLPLLMVLARLILQMHI